MGVTWSFIVQGAPLTVHGIYSDGKPKLAKKLIADGRHVSYVNEKGRFYSSRAQYSSRSYGTRWQGHVDLIREAVALGALPKSNVLALAKLAEARRLREHQSYAARDVLNGAEGAGLKLTARQIRALKRKAKRS